MLAVDVEWELIGLLLSSLPSRSKVRWDSVEARVECGMAADTKRSLLRDDRMAALRDMFRRQTRANKAWAAASGYGYKYPCREPSDCRM